MSMEFLLLASLKDWWDPRPENDLNCPGYLTGTSLVIDYHTRVRTSLEGMPPSLSVQS